MIIVCTKDPAIIGWTANPQSGSAQWGPTLVIPANLAQADATQAIAYALTFLQPNTPLLLNAHGSDTELGDANNGPGDWTWNVNTIAGILAAVLGNGYAGPILISACANQITNFSARLAVALQNGQALNRVWIYGYNRAVPVNQVFPDPNNLANQVDLQGTQVFFN